MRLTLTTNEGEVLDFIEVTREEFDHETRQYPFGVLNMMSPGTTEQED